MNLSLAPLLSDAADKLKSVSANLHTARLRRLTRHAQERLHDVAASVDRALDSIGGPLRDLRSTTEPYLTKVAETATPYLTQAAATATPYLERAADAATPYVVQVAEAAASQADALRDSIATNARAVGKLIRRRNVVARHPFVIAIAVTSACYFVIRRWRSRRAQPAATRRSAKPTAAAGRPSRTKATAARTRKTRRARNGATPASAETAEKALH
jgi:hypothetical protein